MSSATTGSIHQLCAELVDLLPTEYWQRAAVASLAESISFLLLPEEEPAAWRRLSAPLAGLTPETHIGRLAIEAFNLASVACTRREKLRCDVYHGDCVSEVSDDGVHWRPDPGRVLDWGVVRAEQLAFVSAVRDVGEPFQQPVSLQFVPLAGLDLWKSLPSEPERPQYRWTLLEFGQGPVPQRVWDQVAALSARFRKAIENG